MYVMYRDGKKDGRATLLNGMVRPSFRFVCLSGLSVIAESPKMGE